MFATTTQRTTFALVTLLGTAAATADTVTLAPKSPGGSQYTVEGTITDHRGDVLVIQRPGGAQKTYPATRVIGFETEWPAAYNAARRSIERRAWAAAAGELESAARAEKRIWARRRILADLMRCQMSLGRWEPAGQLMLLLARSDPQSPAWSSAPLPWFAADYVRPAVAERWLASSDSEAARLLGAAWLLATPQRVRAEQTLAVLRSSGSPIIASLATAQLWRTELLSVTPQQVDLWREQIEKQPANLRAGPRHLLAQANYRLARYDAAALAALESPFTGSAPRELTARGLLLAGQAVAKQEHREEARRLWMEVRDDYPDTPQHDDATSLLNAQK